MEGKVPKAEGESIADKSIIAIALISTLFTVISVLVLWRITNNFYDGSYYTISVLFDAIGFYPYLGQITVMSTEFYQMFSFMLLEGIMKIFIIGFLIASIIELISNVDVKSKLNVLTAKKFRNHVIICGYSSFAERLIKELQKEGKRFVVIEKDKTIVETLKDLNYVVVEGDFGREFVLEEASVRNADAVIIDSPKDFYDVLCIITIRRLSKSVRVIVRINDESSITNMVRAGADQCVIPEIIAGMELGESIAKRFR